MTPPATSSGPANSTAPRSTRPGVSPPMPPEPFTPPAGLTEDLVRNVGPTSPAAVWNEKNVGDSCRPCAAAVCSAGLRLGACGGWLHCATQGPAAQSAGGGAVA